jgi:ribonuclease P protein component
MILRVLKATPSSLPPFQRAAPPSAWRCAVVISAKVSKRAVQRNRIRRLIHAHLLRHPPLPRQAVWMVISLKPGSMELNDSQLLGQCTLLLRTAGLIP